MSDCTELLFDFGPQPISNRFLSATDKGMVPKFSAQLGISLASGPVTLHEPFFQTDEVCPQFDWMTCFEPEDHLDELVQKIQGIEGISNTSRIGGFSFKDDTTLARLAAKGFRNTRRIDPAGDPSIKASGSGIGMLQGASGTLAAMRIRKKYGPSDVFIVRHGLEHAYNLQDFCNAVRILLAEESLIIWKIPDCQRALIMGDCTMFWEKHTCYFTENSFSIFMRASAVQIIDQYVVDYLLENSIVAFTRSLGVTGADF